MDGNLPRIFALLQEGGHIAPEEMARTFNCGIGMAVIVAADQADDVRRALEGCRRKRVRDRPDRGRPARLHRRRQERQLEAAQDWSATHNA